MARRKIGAGLTSLTLPVSVKDTSSTTGGGLSGLVFNTAGLVCEYRRQGQSAWTTVTLSAGTLGTWSSGGFVADGSQAGDYEVGLPDAAGASGARWVIIRLRGATNMLPVRVEIELDSINYQDGVRGGLTALPNAAAGASGGLPLGDASARVDVGRILGTASAGAAGTVALDTAQALPASPTAGTTGAALFYGAQQIGRTGTAQAGGANTITLDAGASAVDNIYASHEIKITSGTGAGQFATLTAYNGTTKVATITRPGTGNWTTNPDATSVFLILPVPYVTVQASLDKTAYSLSSPQTFNLTGNVTGNVSGSVGSVTGAVGSVTGNVGGNVAGSVGSVTGAVGSVTAAVTAGTVSDKTGYALTTAEHTAISGTDVPAGLTAQGYTATRASYLDTLNGLVAAIWASVSRTLTAISDSNGVTTLLSRLTAGRATNLDNLDAAVSSRGTGDATAASQSTINANVLSRLAASAYTAPPSDYQQRGVAVTLPALPNVTVGGYAAGQDPATLTWGAVTRTLTAFAFTPNSGNPGLTSAQQTELDAVKAKTDNLPADPASSTQVGSRMATFTYTAPANPTDYARNNVAPSWWVSPDNADVATALSDLVSLLARTDPTTALTTLQTAATAIKAKTDLLTFTGSNVNAVISGDATTTLYGDAGAIDWTYTVFDVDGTTPLPGTSVQVAADSAGTHRSQAKLTDSLGRVHFSLDAGTVYVFRTRADRTFSNPDTEIVGP